jgi:putative transposase
MELKDTHPESSTRMVLKVAQLSVGAWYDKRQAVAVRRKPGPKVRYSDDEVLEAIKSYLSDPIFYMEGYKKLKVRLRDEMSIDVGKERLRRIMCEHQLLCKQENRPHPVRYEHNGTIVTSKPNEVWGMDFKEFRTSIGKVYFFDITDHYNSEIKGCHVSQRATAKDAMEAIRNAVRNEFGQVSRNICKAHSLKLRVDHGSQFDAKEFEREIQFLGIEKSSAFVRSPQSNGVIERFHRTAQEQILHIHSIRQLEEAKIKITEFVNKYNQKWLLHRLGLKSPLDYKKIVPSGNTEPEGVRQ